MDSQYESKLAQYLDKISSVNCNYNSIVKELVSSPHCQSWQILQQILDQIQTMGGNIYKDMLKSIEDCVSDLKSFTMLIFLYAISANSKTFGNHIYWKAHYIKVCLDGGEITLFSTWVSLQPKSQIVQNSLWLIISTFPTLFHNQHIQMSEVQLNAVLEWVTYIDSPDPQKYTGVCQIVKMAKETRIYIREDYIRKQHLILKKLIEVAGQSPQSSSSIFLFIYPFTLQEKDISYFCHVYCDFLTDLAEQNLINFFTSITKSAISKQLVFLVFKISQLLKNQQQFFKLRIIYQNYILPILTKRAKACPKVQQAVYDVCSFYILGFLKHCDIGIEGVKCILYKIQSITNEKIQEKWINLCGIICHHYSELRSPITKQLREKLKRTIEINSQSLKQELENQEVVWNVSIRSGRKHKKYPKVISKLRGIENKNNDCYIISTVQALEKSGCLTSLLDSNRSQIKGKLPLLDELRILFSQISGRRPAKIISISYLKKRGPQYFTTSHQQQDVQQYILELFTAIQNQCSKIGLLEQFKKIFEIKKKNNIICTNCKRVASTEQLDYIHTISQTQILQQISEQESLPDYQCDRCHKKCSKIQIQLQPSSKIMIVHINRFSHEKGKAYKQLSTQMILRKFMDYQLIGMICHIGKNVEHGHYIYYGKLGALRWAQFNDRYVEQFQLTKEDQQFQREMKAEMTPYILFYRKISQ